MLRAVGRYLRRLVFTAAGATLAVFIAIEISIPNGFRTVVLPGGFNPNSVRDVEWTRA